jgi:hypothetical protein
MVYEAFGRADELHRNSGQGRHDDPDFQGHPDIPNIEEEINLANLIQECTEPVWEEFNQSGMQSGVVLVTLCQLYGIPDTFFTALLTFLARDLLPSSNCLSRTAYEVKTMIRMLGLQHETPLADLDKCPTCDYSKYVTGSNNVPISVLRYFPIIPRLQRMFKCPEVAKLMEYYSSAASRTSGMKSIVDSYQWKEINRLYPEFARVSTNIRLALIANGVCPFGNQSSKHSTWIILLAIHNLLGWLVSKKFFLNLSLLIPGPRVPTSEFFDVFLNPVVWYLVRLWTGVPALNMAKLVGEQAFTLKAILIWTINDFPAYGLVSGQQMKGYKGCPICGKQTCLSILWRCGKWYTLARGGFFQETIGFVELQWHLTGNLKVGTALCDGAVLKYFNKDEIDHSGYVAEV